MRRALAAVLLAGASAAVIAMPNAGAADDGAFTGVARADGFRVTMHAKGLAAEELTDTSGPSAQAKVDSLGISEGFAALPYPGDTATAGVGLVSSLILPVLGIAPPDLPQYPLVVHSQYPGHPKATLTQGPLSLTAESAPSASSAEARGSGADSGGNAVGNGVSTASVKVDESGTVLVDATATAEAFTVAGVLRIGGLAATAHAEGKPGEEPTMRSSFTAEGVTIAGTPVGITDKGLVVTGTNAPLPDSSPLTQALESAGIDVRYVAPVTTSDSAQAAGLDITSVQQGPNGPATVTYSLGKVRVELAGAAAPEEASVDLGVPFDEPVVLATEMATSPPASPPATPQGDTSQAAAGTVRTTPAATGSIPILTTSAFAFYLILVVGAAVALGGSVLLRLFAVRLAWAG